MQDFRKLDVWLKAHRLVLSVYQATKDLPREEIFGVTMQARRSATSIATRIAERCGCENTVDKGVNWRKAGAVANELEYIVLLATDLGYLKEDVRESLTADIVEVRKMLFGLVRKL